MTGKNTEKRARLRHVLDSAYRSKRNYVGLSESMGLVKAIIELMTAVKCLLPGVAPKDVSDCVFASNAYACLSELKKEALRSVIICQRVEHPDIGDYICRAAALKGSQAIGLKNVQSCHLREWSDLCSDICGLRRWHDIEETIYAKRRAASQGVAVDATESRKMEASRQSYMRLVASIDECPQFLHSPLADLKGAHCAGPAIVCEKVTAVANAGVKKRSVRRSLRRARRKSIVVNAVS